MYVLDQELHLKRQLARGRQDFTSSSQDRCKVRLRRNHLGTAVPRQELHRLDVQLVPASKGGVSGAIIDGEGLDCARFSTVPDKLS